MGNPIWHEGDTVLLRGMYADRPVYIQSARMIKDSPTETIIAVWPGAECAAPAGYLRSSHNRTARWNRWEETMGNCLQIEKYHWHTNRFLIILEPEKYFSSIHIWNAQSDQFVCYYINFQLPFQRTRLGFDTLDLDLDIVIQADYRWQWKDIDDYQEGIRSGGIKVEWIGGIEQARKEVAARLKSRQYPLDGSWLSWKPNPAWQLPKLPEGWDQAA